MPEQTATQRKQFTITRVLDAPRAQVWRVWTDPEEAPHWLHPRSLTTPRDSVEFDVRPGGVYRYTMVAPDGTEYPSGGTYREVVPPERLVFTWGGPDDPDATMPVVTVQLDEQGASGEQTLMTFRVVGVEGQPGDNNFYDGWAEALDLLAERAAGSAR
jgi:uncharacterized protein YndB with AHSA1/START domain